MNIAKFDKWGEALDRMQELCDRFRLGNDLVDKLRAEELYYSAEFSIKSIQADDRYRNFVRSFETDHNALVYHVIESVKPEGSTILTLLFVSDFKGNWEKERIKPDGTIFAYEGLVDDSMSGGFGNDIVEVKIEGMGGHLVRIG